MGGDIMEKYMFDIITQEDVQGRIPFQNEWEHLRDRIGYAMVSAKVTPGIELVSKEAFERFQHLLATLPEKAQLVSQLFTKSMWAWDEMGEMLVLSQELMEYGRIEKQAVLLAGEDFIALCSPETAKKY